MAGDRGSGSVAARAVRRAELVCPSTSFGVLAEVGCIASRLNKVGLARFLSHKPLSQPIISRTQPHPVC